MTLTLHEVAIVPFRTVSGENIDIKMEKYVVHKGRNPGYYGSWGEAKEQVQGFPGNCHEKVGRSSTHYVVYDGAKPGVYDSWPDTHDQVSGYPGAKYQRAKSSSDAATKWSNYKTSK